MSAGAIGLLMILAAYMIAGVFTVKEYFWFADVRYLTASEILTIILIFLLWPLALAYWRISK